MISFPFFYSKYRLYSFEVDYNKQIIEKDT